MCLVSHLVVGLEELLSDDFAFVSPTLLLYRGRAEVAGSLVSGTLGCAAVEELLTGGLGEVDDRLSSITTCVSCLARYKLNPCRKSRG